MKNTADVTDDKELDGLAVSVLRRMIAKVKQRWSVIGWATKNLLSRASFRASEGTLSCWFQLICSHQSALGPHGGLGPFSTVVSGSTVGTLIGW
jgi:hypothetical protein